MNRVRRISFVVRVVQDRRGEVGRVIERVEPFTGMEAIGQVTMRTLSVKGPWDPPTGQ